MTLKLPRLASVQPRWSNFQTWWQQVVEAVEGHEDTQDEILAELLLAIASISEVAPITIAADYQGAVNPADQLPYEVAIKRFSSDVDVTTDTSWSVATTTGDITASIGAATGILSITAIGSSGTLTVTSIYNGVVKTRLVSITLAVAAPPSTGSSGAGSTTSSDTSFDAIAAASHAPISDELTVTVGASGIVTLSAVLTVRTAKTAPTGSFEVFGKWQWWDGAAWQDVAAEVASSPDATVSNAEGIYTLDPGTLTVNTSKTGLTPATSAKFRLEARNSVGTRGMTFTGTASAVP